MSQCRQLFSGTQKFITVRTTGISCVSGLRASRFLTVFHSCMHMIRGIHFAKVFTANTAHSFRYTCSSRSGRVRFFLDCCAGGKFFPTILTVGIACIAFNATGCIFFVYDFCIFVLTFASCNRNAYTFCLVVALVSSCINRSRRHSHTICKCRVLICLLPAPAFRKYNIANLLCAVCRCHRSFRHVRSFRCLVDRKNNFHINSIIIICI